MSDVDPSKKRVLGKIDENYVGGGAPAGINPETGQHHGYWILSPEERAKGFVRPVRTSYTHSGERPRFPLRDLTEDEKKHDSVGYVAFEAYPDSEAPLTGRMWKREQLESGCRSVTSMPLAIAETWARDLKFYGGTFCCSCRKHLPVAEFTWDDGSVLGT